MTRVDFYTLARAGAQARQDFACRLVEKAYRRGHTVYVHTADAEAAAVIDELLWIQRPQSFVPHGLLEQAPQDSTRWPVAIGCGSEPGPYHDLLINLAVDIPEFFSRFERVSEIVTEDEELKAAKRVSYRFYKDRGYPGAVHPV